ncbi:hypothetical protein [Methylobacterium sp. J-076]|uniref:hypothetical protein n=1 Tax=Methylobacterium sp. J-076 TaxID=2836655 RepID=UPI001FB8F9EC|nr:hypothetical protein [Methylobacterium sp. J-076]MCJ2012618.1 hypothetical protein [Methylobacterium sp. J-076]
MSWPAAVLWVLIIAMAFARGPGLLYLLMISSVFGTLQMLPGGGGTTLLPQTACGLVFVGKVAIQRGNVLRGIEVALDPRRLALFSAFLAYGVFGAFVLPRMFAGLFEVMPVSSAYFGADILKPAAGNITQSCYMILSFAVALSFAVIGQSEVTRDHYRRALLYAAYALVCTGFLDLVCYTLGLGALLEPFRTATYSLLIDVEAEGVKRVVGLMPEASTYGTACVSMLAALTFMRPLYRAGRERLLVLGAMGLLALMAMLSTSSTAIVGIGLFGLVYGLDLLVRLVNPRNPRRGQLNIEILIIFLALVGMFVAFVLKPNLFDPVLSMVDSLVLQKTNTASYAERSSWNRIGWQAFIDSGGLGAGLGSIRTSNWGISILGSTGVLGAVLMFGFITQHLVAVPGRVPQHVLTFTTALKLALLPSLAMSLLSATMPDIGIAAASVLGLLAAAHAPAGARVPRQGPASPEPARALA